MSTRARVAAWTCSHCSAPVAVHRMVHVVYARTNPLERKFFRFACDKTRCLVWLQKLRKADRKKSKTTRWVTMTNLSGFSRNSHRPLARLPQ